MSEITRNREEISKLFFSKVDQKINPNDIDIRAICSVLVGGIYYLILHSKYTESTFCEIELDNDGFHRIRNVVKQVLNWAYNDSK